MATVTDLIVITALQILTLWLTYWSINFFTQNFVNAWLKVKMGKGKYVLAKVRGITTDYVKPGLLDGDKLVYKNKTKTEKTIFKINKDAIYRSYGVWCIDLDETKNAVCKADYSTVDGYDAEKVTNLLKRALYRPVPTSRKEALILLGVLAAVVGIVLALFLIIDIQGTLKTLVEAGVSQTIQ